MRASRRPEHAVADDQVGRHDRFALAAAGHRVVGRGGQGQQHARSPSFVRPVALVARHHHARRSAAEQAAHLAVAARPGTNTRSPTR
jgi:hypothetical protein